MNKWTLSALAQASKTRMPISFKTNTYLMRTVAICTTKIECSAPDNRRNHVLMVTRRTVLAMQMENPDPQPQPLSLLSVVFSSQPLLAPSSIANAGKEPMSMMGRRSVKT